MFEFDKEDAQWEKTNH